MRVDDAVEFASYLLLQDVGAPSVLFDIIPVVKPAVASYSAWESTNAGRLDDDLATIQRQLGPGSELILGEFGSMASVPAVAWRFMESVKAAKRAHVPVITVWEAFTTIDQADGLLDFNGGEKQVLRCLREVDADEVLDMSGSIVISGTGVIPREKGGGTSSCTGGFRHLRLRPTMPRWSAMASRYQP